MEWLTDLGIGMLSAIQPAVFVAALLGVIIGVIIGVIPGLGPAVAMSLAIPLTFTLSPAIAISLLLGIYKGGTYGGSISAILINTPGTPAAAATILDGYPLAKQGKAGKALHMALYASVCGDAVSIMLLLAVAQPLASIALMFGPPELFSLLLFAMTVIGGLAGESLLRGIISAVMGGLLAHISSLCAITNPSTNSFKRLVPGFEAPVTVGYATSNRSAVIRIPAYAKSPDTKRFELRNPDATCNPYYAYAAILMAGIDGVLNKIDPSACGWGPYDFNLYDLSDDEKARIESLPRTLEEALDALEADHDYLTAGGVFPERLIEIWIDRKRREALELSQIPTPAEFGKYFDL